MATIELKPFSAWPVNTRFHLYGDRNVYVKVSDDQATDERDVHPYPYTMNPGVWTISTEAVEAVLRLEGEEESEPIPVPLSPAMYALLQETATRRGQTIAEALEDIIRDAHKDTHGQFGGAAGQDEGREEEAYGTNSRND